MNRSSKKFATITMISCGALGCALGCALWGYSLFADSLLAGQTASAPGTSAPVRALTPYVEEHTHFDEKNIAGAVRSVLAGLEKQNAAMIFLQIPPETFDDGTNYDAEIILPAVKKYPNQIRILGGGGSLNPMIMKSVATRDSGPEITKKFKEKAEELLSEGVVGFGEMAAEHFAGTSPYEYAPPNHPLYYLLADIAAEHGVPIVLHMEAVPADMALPMGLKIPPNPRQIHANIAAFEQLLKHNPRAKIVWAHAGQDNTGYRTPDLCRRLLAKYPNLYIEIKTDPMDMGLNYPLDGENKIKPDWLKLIMDFPDRFIMGSDQHYPDSMSPGQRWQADVLLFNQLPETVRKKVGTENVAHIYGKSIAASLHVNQK